jgi:hypothetical protein
MRQDPLITASVAGPVSPPVPSSELPPAKLDLTVPFRFVAAISFTVALVGVRDLLYGTAGNVILSILFWAIGVTVSILASRSLERQERVFLIRTFVLAFSLRVLAAVVLWMLVLSMTGVPFHPGGDDADFDRHGQWIAEAWRAGDWGYRLSGSYSVFENGYNYVVATVYYLGGIFGGSDQLGAVLLNCLFGALLVLPGYRIARTFYGESIARRASAFLAYAPDLFLYSLVELRDILIALLIIVLAWCVSDYLVGYGKISKIVIGAIIAAYAVPALRIELLPVTFATLAANFAAISAGRLKVRQNPRLFAALGLLMAISVLFYVQGEFLIAMFSNPFEPVNRYVEHYRATAAMESLGVHFFTLPIYLRLPANLGMLMTLPFPPWAGIQYDRTWFSVLQTVEAPFWYVLAPYFLIGMMWSFRENKFLYFPVYGTCLIWIIAASFGAMVDLRWRTMVMPMMLVIAAVGWQHWRKYVIVPGLWWAAIMVAVLAYIFLKWLV